jgi:TP901-1 family phage major tail protein
MHAKLYQNTGSYASPTWSLMGNVKDVTLNLETGEADVTTRGNDGWRATVATLREASVEFEMIWDPSDAGFTAIQTAFFANSMVELAVMDGDITTAGSQGLRATCMITSFSRAEALEEAITASVTAKPTYADNAPEWYTVS